MHAFRMLLFGFVLIANTGIASAQASNPIGSALTVVNLVTAKHASGPDHRRLSAGDDVRERELIEVDRDGRSELEFHDRTKLALGPGSRLLLDKFVYNANRSGGDIALDLAKGTLRFITGIAAKPAYAIHTPAASIAVRGTIFDLFVLRPDETWLLLLEGAVEVCANNGTCAVHDQPGKMIRITRDGIEKPVKWAGLKGKGDITLDQAFPFVASPPAIDSKPIFSRSDIAGSGEQKTEHQGRDEHPKRIERRIPAPPLKIKHHDDDDDDDYRPSKRTRERVARKIRDAVEREDRDYEDHARGSRAGDAIKKTIKVGAGLAVGYGLAKVLRGRGRY